MIIFHKIKEFFLKKPKRERGLNKKETPSHYLEEDEREYVKGLTILSDPSPFGDTARKHHG